MGEAKQELPMQATVFGDGRDINEDNEEIPEWARPYIRTLKAQVTGLLAERDETREETFLRGVASVTAIRCHEHHSVPLQNGNEASGGECGACIAAQLAAVTEERNNWHTAWKEQLGDTVDEIEFGFRLIKKWRADSANLQAVTEELRQHERNCEETVRMHLELAARNLAAVTEEQTKWQARTAEWESLYERERVRFMAEDAARFRSDARAETAEANLQRAVQGLKAAKRVSAARKIHNDLAARVATWEEGDVERWQEAEAEWFAALNALDAALLSDLKATP